MDTGPFTIQKRRRPIAISRLRNGKALGVQNICAEMPKISPAIALNQLLNTGNQDLNQCKAPPDRRKPLLAKIPKKHRTKRCTASTPSWESTRAVWQLLSCMALRCEGSHQQTSSYWMLSNEDAAGIFWSHTITKRELHERARESSTTEIVKDRRDKSVMFWKMRKTTTVELPWPGPSNTREGAAHRRSRGGELSRRKDLGWMS